MHNTEYRKYNVDDFDPAQFYDHHDNLEDCGPDEEKVRQLLESNQLQDALKASLLSPPLGHQEQDLKDNSTLLVAHVLHSFKSSDLVQEIIDNQLSMDEADILMKYIYKAMQLSSDGSTCQSLMTWHSVLVAKFGQGAIVRVFAGRQRL